MAILNPITGAEDLMACLRSMGTRQTNPVLDVLGDTKTIVEGQKFPLASKLLFGAGRWRAYYHCHPAPQCHDQEHGHFHLFARVGSNNGANDWGHVIGLSMDSIGQPLSWFSVNRWVTDGPWVAAAAFETQLESLAVVDDTSLTARYLQDLLLVYQDEIRQLFSMRDAKLTQVKESRQGITIDDDRTVYCLAQRPVRLVEKLQQLLSPESNQNTAAVKSHQPKEGIS